MAAGSITAPSFVTAAAAGRAALAVERVDTVHGLHALREGWRALECARSESTPFTSWEWAYSWWLAYGAGRRLRVLVFRGSEGIIAIAPFYLERERVAPGLWTRVLRLIGDGSQDSDYLGFPMRSGSEDAVLARLATWLREERGWDALVARVLPERSPLAAGLPALAVAGRLPHAVDASPCAALALPDSFEAFLRDRRSRFRTKLRSLLRRIDEGELTFVADCPPRELRARLRSLFRLHQSRWQAAGGPGVFGTSAKRRFYAHFAARFLRAGWLRLYTLRRGDTDVAHELCFGRNGVTYLLQEGFDTSDGAASYGQALRAAVIRHLIEQKEATYDFLGGASRHKDDWGAMPARLVHVTIGRNHWRGRLYVRMPALRERAASLAKRLLPQRVVNRLRALRA